MFVQLKESYKLTKSKSDKEKFKENLENILASLNDSVKRSTDKLKQLMRAIVRK